MLLCGSPSASADLNAYLCGVGQGKKRPMGSRKEKQMNVVKSYRNWRSYRNAAAELSGLTNRDLADLGIARADIRAVARQSVK
jgi:uncharacterized protein YjiS (DUF1127 family)